MAQLDDIREGIAANLYALKTNRTVGHVSAYMQENPQTPSLHVVGIQPFEYGLGFGSGAGDEWLVLIEAVLGRVTDIGGQKTQNALLATSGDTSLKVAVEADRQLTSRLGDDGKVTANQTPACSDLIVSSYLGQSRPIMGGAELLVSAWAVRVIA